MSITRDMTIRTARLTLAAAIGLSALAGCSREGDKAGASESPAAQASLKDEVFKAKLRDQVSKRNELASARNAVVEKMAEMIEAKKKELGTDDLEKVRAELEKDPAWRELRARCEDANTAISENRKSTMAVVREKLAKPNAK